MTKTNNNLTSLDKLKVDCEKHHQVTLALLTLIENSASEEAIKLIAEEVHEKAEEIYSKIAYCDTPELKDSKTANIA